jgi:2'-5' RNA ligase
MGKIRCFVGLELPQSFVNELIRVQILLESQKLLVGKMTAPENLHLTLKFLGEITPDVVEEVNHRLSNVNMPVFKGCLREIGVFSRRDVRVIWLTLWGQGVLSLQKAVDEALVGLFEPEVRFMSHITIARVKQVEDQKRLLDWIDQQRVYEQEYEFDRFFLKRSELYPTGPVYSDLESYLLG